VTKTYQLLAVVAFDHDAIDHDASDPDLHVSRLSAASVLR
jgi:hypothetical protein